MPDPRTDAELAAMAADLLDHRLRRETRSAITDDGPLSIDEAYRIQSYVTSARLERGERIAGWKLGYTSEAMRVQMGVASPNFGPLTDAMLLATGDTASPALMQPRVEPEIGLVFARDLVAPTTVADVLDAVANAVACLEVVDSVYTGYRFHLEDNTADGSSAAQVVVGPPLSGIDALDEIEVALVRNGAAVATARGSAASGHPALGVVWLAEQLARTGRVVRAGDLVITGGLTAAAPLEPGDVIGATFSGGAEVSVLR
ncbi:MAG: fumarylacetoacetate hydrolase family protein [Actinobacteria bacterium]|nr:fumarylacetoacetate hydrolase family protein [Actinomycetota bacterium]